MQDLLINASLLNIEISEQQMQQLSDFYSLLLEWNQKFNLTSITNSKEVAIKHFLDSLTCTLILNDYIANNSLPDSGSSLLDVGSGAGFPGIPLKIYYPQLKITLLDSLGKRIVFLNEVIARLSLQHINAVHARAEEVSRKTDWREQYQFVTSRAVARLNILAEYCLPFLQVGGLFFAMKGPDYHQEFTDSKRAIEILGGQVLQVKKIILPVVNNERNIIVIKKIRNTPIKYPRSSALISKKAL